MARVCVVGSVNSDLVFDVAALPGPGETVLASAVRTLPGGKGGNQAVAAARAGADVTLVAAVGDDAAGRTLLDHLSANGVGTDGVVTLPVPSGSAVVVVGAGGENMIVVAPGANAHLTLDSPHLRDIVAAADIVLLQLEIPVATALVAARQARETGATVILNASPVGADERALAELAEVVDVVVVNETEAAAWQWPVPHLVTTLGSRGARHTPAPAPASRWLPPASKRSIRRARGDVFAGVLAAGWTADRHHALRRACAAGALATLVPGAGDCAPYDEAIEDALTGN